MDNVIICRYEYPKSLYPDLHHAIYQTIVGVEQNHSREMMLSYAMRLRELAEKHVRVLEDIKA